MAKGKKSKKKGKKKKSVRKPKVQASGPAGIY